MVEITITCWKCHEKWFKENQEWLRSRKNQEVGFRDPSNPAPVRPKYDYDDDTGRAECTGCKHLIYLHIGSPR